jgi:hypothetical protein
MMFFKQKAFTIASGGCSLPASVMLPSAGFCGSLPGYSAESFRHSFASFG